MLHPLIKHGAPKFYVASSVRCVSLLPRSSIPLMTFGTTIRHSTSAPEPASLTTSSGRDNVVRWTSNRGNGNSEKPQEGNHEPETEQEAESIQNQSENSINVRGLDGEKVTLSAQDQVLSLHRNVLEGLQHRQPYNLLNAFLNASQNPFYLEVLPTTTLKEILRSIDPKYFLDPFKAVHQDLGEDSSYISYLHQDIRQLHEVFGEYTRCVHSLLSRWRESGHKFGLAEYTILLNIARSTGRARMAMDIWNSMRADEIDPDTTCYNYFFEARCWSNAYDVLEKYKLRVIPHYLEERQSTRRKRGFLGHRTGPRGIRTEILKNFDFMIKSGVKPDVNTFSMFIQALGREGDLEGVQSVLRQVWDVDLGSALEEEDTELLFQSRLSPTSLTYPNKDLLFTIAHILGSNNRLPAALRVIDIFSRKYDIEIDLKTWIQLFQWTFVLSSRQFGKYKEGGSNAGQLPKGSVENLWNTITSEPYNVKPTMPMYNRYVKNLATREMLDALLEIMRAGRALHEAQEQTLKDLLTKGIDTESIAFEDGPISEPEAGSIAWEQQQELEIERLKLYRDYVMLCRWVRLLMSGRRWISSDAERRLGWERIRVPNAVYEFWDYRPANGFKYWTMTCEVRFHRTPPRDMVIESTNGVVPGVLVVQDTEACYLRPVHDPGIHRKLETQILNAGPKIRRADGTMEVFEVLE